MIPIGCGIILGGSLGAWASTDRRQYAANLFMTLFGAIILFIGSILN